MLRPQTPEWSSQSRAKALRSQYPSRRHVEGVWRACGGFRVKSVCSNAGDGMSSLAVNLSFLIEKPTGLMTYAQNVVPYLQALDPTLFIHHPLEGYHCHPIPGSLTADYGTRGHAARLVWTQFQLPRLYNTVNAQLLFSPLPEAPLFTRCRYVVTLHDLIPLRFPNPRRPLYAYHRWIIPAVLKQAARVICISEATYRDALQFAAIDPNKVSLVPLACNTDHFRYLSLPTQPYFLYVGRYDKHKNLSRLLAAFQPLAQHQGLELWIAGSPNPKVQSALQGQAVQLGIAPQVKMLDYVPYDQLPILFNQALALVLPSLWEGFGLPILEAMACGTPVITSNIASMPEVAGDAAVLVDPYSVGSIQAALQEVAESAGLRSQLRERGLARILNFSWARTGAMTSAVLQDVLNTL